MTASRRPLKLRVFGVLALCGAAAILSGCGSSGDTTAALSKAQFIKQADAICRQADKQQNAALISAQKELKGKKQTQKEQEELVTDVGLPPIQEEAEQIADLGAPKGDEDEIAAIVSGIEEAVDKAEADPSKALESFARVDKMSTEYGFKDCAEAL